MYDCLPVLIFRFFCSFFHLAFLIIDSHIVFNPILGQFSYVVEITIKMKTIIRKPLMIKINKLRLRNLDNWLFCVKVLNPLILPQAMGK